MEWEIAAEGMNIAHGVKKVDVNQLKAFRDRFDLPISDEEVESYSYYKPDENSPEVQYLKEKRAALGGFVPQRREKFSNKLEIPALSKFESIIAGSGDREISTTNGICKSFKCFIKR